MQRQKADVYVRQRTQPKGPTNQNQDDHVSASSNGYVARSAFKLLQLDDRYKFLRPGRVIVDLGAAPGGWSQAIVERTRSRTAGKVFALDLLPVVGIEGVTSIQGDFLDVDTQERLRRMVADAALGSADGNDAAKQSEGFVDVVVSDMMGEFARSRASDRAVKLTD